MQYLIFLMKLKVQKPGETMKNQIESLIKQYVASYTEIKNVQTKWKEPIISYADANDEMFYILKDVVSPTHAMPKDMLPEAESVVAYFIPFEDYVVKSNIEDKECSKEWAVAYVETNQLIADLNAFIKKEFNKLGYKLSSAPATHNFDEKKLISDWSHRHVAYIAGLGRFGLNNMLITDKGCCGRIGTFVTNLKLESTKRSEKESCLYKHNKSCKKCVKRCINDALAVEGFDRFKCYEMCLINDKFHSEITSLTDVCGKCLVNIPCSTMNPVK